MKRSDIDLAFEAAAKRVTYRLSFKRNKTNRQFDGGVLRGDDIPNAYARTGMAPGDWCAEFPDQDTAPGYVREFFAAAVAEAMHEVMEWFREDGELMIDPHSPHRLEDEIVEKCNGFARHLFDEYAVVE